MTIAARRPFDGYGPVFWMLICAAGLFAARDAHALPLFANDGPQACFACHIDGAAGQFVAGLSVNKSRVASAGYVPLDWLNKYGGGLGLSWSPGSIEARRVAVEGFWRPAQYWRLGAGYAPFERSWGGVRDDPGGYAGRDASWFFYVRGAY